MPHNDLEQMRLDASAFLQAYQTAVRETAATRDPHEMVALSALGLIGELGEVFEPIKKVRYNDRPLEIDLTEELGDVLWYYALLCNALGIPLIKVFENNLAKMHKRFPSGFDLERSRTRCWEKGESSHE